jgi:polyferredoxin
MNQTKKSNPLFELLINIVIPSVILMKFSGEQNLCAVGGLLVGIGAPLAFSYYWELPLALLAVALMAIFWPSFSITTIFGVLWMSAISSSRLPA